MKQCRECGTLSRDETVFCYICGTKFSELSEDATSSQVKEAVNNLVYVLNAIISKK